MVIKVATIDDEPLALELITSYINKTPDLSLVGAFSNPLKGLRALEKEDVDLLFLDIRMPDISGIEFTRIMEKGPMVVFTTAYEQYALEGFRADAIDYLLKPFSYEEFLVAVRKARRMLELEASAGGHLSSNDEFLFVKSEYRVRRINFSDIKYIEGMKDYVKIHLVSDSRPVLSLSSMKNIESRLPVNLYMRVHRSFIVNLTHVNTIERNRIVFGKERVPVGEQYKDKFQEFLKRNFL